MLAEVSIEFDSVFFFFSRGRKSFIIASLVISSQYDFSHGGVQLHYPMVSVKLNELKTIEV